MAGGGLKEISELGPDLEALASRIGTNLGKVAQEVIHNAEHRIHTRHRWKDKTGATDRAVSVSINVGATEGSAAVLVDSENAIRLNDGTRPHEIRPVNARVLAFEQDGEQVFARSVQHPGTEPDPYLDEAADEVDQVLDSLIDQALDDAMSG